MRPTPRISEWPAAERPRERLRSQGPAALSDAELLALILRTGYRRASAVDLARALVLQFGSLAALLDARLDVLQGAAGLGEAKAASLGAVVELARRYLGRSVARGNRLGSSAAVKVYLRARFGAREREVFAVVLLDAQHRVVELCELFFGTIDGASVHAREVVRVALEHNAAAVILVHNHPSGVAEPSDADIRLTGDLRDVLGVIDVRVLDHLVVAREEVVSFAERGLL